MSLAYNSRWKANGPTLIGPKLTSAVKEGRWEDAAYEIEFNSAGGVPASLKKGILARRRYEAALFRGASDDLLE
jgi:GH24 family phage-related lysozyme (muramidase)